MRMVDIIHKKRDGHELTEAEINFAIEGYTKDIIPDYQMSAFAMAIYYKGMTDAEVSALTMAMVKSGDIIDLSAIEGVKVDKHSTGGVGDKVSLIVGPLVASTGVPIAKMSGRGLGHTGGTIDKLEAIEGFKTELTSKEFIENVNKHKLAIVGQSGNLTPADKKLYALRDVTATVDSIPLIASSIMSKKIASGADAICLDVKVGSGAFMKSIEDARKLATTMVQIGNRLNRKTAALITDMNQPLGREIGNANEIKEAILVLKGEGPEDLFEICVEIAANMIVLAGKVTDLDAARDLLQQNISNGMALNTFKRFIKAQGGNEAVVDHPDLLVQPCFHINVYPKENGFVEAMDAEMLGIAAMLLGAGRNTKEDKIDYAVGITLTKKIGDEVNKDEPIAIIHSNREQVESSIELIQNAFGISKNKVEKSNLIYDVIKE